MNFEAKFLSVLCGDAILIRFLGDDNNFRNILIDGGYVKTYSKILKPELLGIKNRGEKIDLLILSHYDNDHIGGITAFINDKTFDIETFVENWWLNIDLPLMSKYGLISIGQLNTLQAFLKKIGKQSTAPFLENSIPSLMFGAKITILSPDILRYTNSKNHIEAHNTKIAGKQSDHNTKLEDFCIVIDSIEDIAIPNGSSIAVLVEISNKSILLLADAYPSVIYNSLVASGYSTENKLKVDFVKLSHHGSKFNTNNRLIDLIETDNYIICANGFNGDNLPNKETLARVLLHKNRNQNKQLNFHFTNQDKILENIFKIDGDTVFEKYNFRVHFPNKNFLGIILK